MILSAVFVIPSEVEESRALALAGNAGCLDYARHDDICKSSHPRRSIFPSESCAGEATAFMRSRRSLHRFRSATKSKLNGAMENRESNFAATMRQFPKA